MPRLDVNLDEVHDHIEPGWYVARVVGSEIKESQRENGGRYINWELEINEPNSEFDGEKVWTITSLKSSALWKLKQFLEACNFEWDPEGFHTEDVHGSELEIQIENEEYEGQTRNRVESFRMV